MTETNEQMAEVAVRERRRAEAAEAALADLRERVGALADEWERHGLILLSAGTGVGMIAYADAAARLRRILPDRAVLDGPSPAAQEATPDGESPCRCGHAKAEHPAPDGDTYCRRCSCAHYLPTVADMMRDTAAVDRLLAAVEKPAAQEATRPDGCVTHQAFWPIGAKVCDAISSGGVVGGGPCVAGEHPAQERTAPSAEATSGGGDRG